MTQNAARTEAPCGLLTPKGVVQIAREITEGDVTAIREYFYARIRRTSHCWEWTGAKSKRGYGVIKFNCGRHSAHRFSVVLHGRSLPTDKIVCHTCDNPGCVNPDHLYVGTVKQNASDREARNRGYKPRGERSGTAKLKEHDVRLIRVIAGSHAEIARKYNVSESLIRFIRKGQRWGHLS